jgi:ATP-dependent DNA helicase RecQ
MAVAANYDAILSRVWGFQGLRPLQQQAVDLTLAGRDALIVMPTGGGKSLCFQLPPLVDDGLTLVVSPLISLMTDQVQGLRLVGYPAEMMHSGLSAKDAEIAAARIQSGESKLVYVSPERVLTNAFVSLLALANQGRGVARVAIDEAHCISAWGHDFRPEYRVLSRLRDIFPQAPITALTATATPQVREDIARQLHLRDPEFLIGDFDRPELSSCAQARSVSASCRSGGKVSARRGHRVLYQPKGH